MIETSQLTQNVSELKADKALDEVNARLKTREDPQAILDACRLGMEEVGKKFESGEYYVADLMYAANIFQRIMEILGPELHRVVNPASRGKIVIATVQDDIHDIGKNLVAAMLSASGFEVIDLGINVPPDHICHKIKEHRPDIVALSCLLTSTVGSVERSIEKMTAAGLRGTLKIIVGGNPLTPELAASIGADAYGDDAYEAIVRCKDLMGR